MPPTRSYDHFKLEHPWMDDDAPLPAVLQPMTLRDLFRRLLASVEPADNSLYPH